MHACSSIIEHNLQSIQQSLLITSSPSRTSSALSQFHVSSSYQLPVSFNPTNLLFPRPSSTINNHLLNSIEINLFHTLHYMILYSNENHNQILSLNIIQLFIYLFIPYIHTYLYNNKKEFLSNNDLIQGMRLIWQPLFEYHQPNIHIFNAFIKPIISSNDQQEQRFIIENTNQHHRLSISIQSPIQKFITNKQPLTDLTNIRIKKELKSSTFISADSDPTTTSTSHNSATDFADYETTTNNNNTRVRAPLVHMNSICSVSDLSRITISPLSPG